MTSSIPRPKPAAPDFDRPATVQNPVARWVAAATLVCTCATAWGQVTLSPTAVVDSDLGEYGVDTPYVNLINQSGVDNPFTSGVTDFNTYFATPGLTWANANY